MNLQVLLFYILLLIQVSHKITAIKIIHSGCYYEPDFNRRFAINLNKQPLHRLFRNSNKKLGRGAFGEVREINWKDDNGLIVMAVKQVRIIDAETQVNLHRELDILWKLKKDPYVVNMFACVESMEKTQESESSDVRVVFIITEKLFEDLEDEPSAAKLVHTFRIQFCPLKKLGVLLQLARALESIHARNVVHSDLKPANIMTVDKQMKELKLVDFGLSNQAGMKQIGGTALFAPPEFQTSSLLQPSFDVYSFGVTVGALEISAKKMERKVSHLWGPNGKMRRFMVLSSYIVEQLKPGYKRDNEVKSDDSIVKIVQDCLNADVGQRITSSQLVIRIEKLIQNWEVVREGQAKFIDGKSVKSGSILADDLNVGTNLKRQSSQKINRNKNSMTLLKRLNNVNRGSSLIDLPIHDNRENSEIFKSRNFWASQLENQENGIETNKEQEFPVLFILMISLIFAVLIVALILLW